MRSYLLQDPQSSNNEVAEVGQERQKAHGSGKKKKPTQITSKGDISPSRHLNWPINLKPTLETSNLL